MPPTTESSAPRKCYEKRPITKSQRALATKRVKAYRKWVKRDAEISVAYRRHEDLETVTLARRGNPMPELPPDDDFKVLDGRKTYNLVKIPCK